MAFGPQAGLELVDALTSEPSLEGYHLLPSVRGDLLAKLGRFEEAAPSSSARHRSRATPASANCSSSAPGFLLDDNSGVYEIVTATRPEREPRPKGAVAARFSASKSRGRSVAEGTEALVATSVLVMNSRTAETSTSLAREMGNCGYWFADLLHRTGGAVRSLLGLNARCPRPFCPWRRNRRGREHRRRNCFAPFSITTAYLTLDQ